MTRPTIILVDDHELFREGVSIMIRLGGVFEVVAQGENSDAAVDLCKSFRPDLLLLDVELNDLPCHATIRRVLRATPSTKIVILTMHRDKMIRESLLSAGASSVITKSIPRAGLLAELANVLSNKPKPASEYTISPAVSRLSARELDVLRLLASSLSVREIGVSLAIAEGTVKRHTSSIYCKLDVRSRIQAVPKARLLGLLDS